MGTIALMSREELERLVFQQCDAIDQQRRLVEQSRMHQQTIESELQGSKVMISMLVQREGGRVEVSDAELQAHEFDLKIHYRPDKLCTVFISDPKKPLRLVKQ